MSLKASQQSVSGGDNVSVSCTVLGEPEADVTFHWTYPGQVGPTATRERLFSTVSINTAIAFKRTLDSRGQQRTDRTQRFFKWLYHVYVHSQRTNGQLTCTRPGGWWTEARVGPPDCPKVSWLWRTWRPSTTAHTPVKPRTSTARPSWPLTSSPDRCRGRRARRGLDEQMGEWHENWCVFELQIRTEWCPCRDLIEFSQIRYSDSVELLYSPSCTMKYFTIYGFQYQT